MPCVTWYAKSDLTCHMWPNMSWLTWHVMCYITCHVLHEMSCVTWHVMCDLIDNIWHCVSWITCQVMLHIKYDMTCHNMRYIQCHAWHVTSSLSCVTSTFPRATSCLYLYTAFAPSSNIHASVHSLKGLVKPTMKHILELVENKGVKFQFVKNLFKTNQIDSQRVYYYLNI